MHKVSVGANENIIMVQCERGGHIALAVVNKDEDFDILPESERKCEFAYSDKTCEGILKRIKYPILD